MTLKIWTDAKAPAIKGTLGPVIAGSGVSHLVVPYIGSLPPFKEGDVVLACGAGPVDTLKKAGVLPKGRAIGSLRQKLFKRGSANILCSWDPNIVNFDYMRKPESQWDIALALRFCKTGSLEPVVGDYQYVDSFGPVAGRIKELWLAGGKKKRVPVSLDLETIGLDPFAPGVYIVTISVTVDEGTAHIMPFPKGPADPLYPGPPTLGPGAHYQNLMDIEWLCNSEMVNLTGANLKFDMLWMAEHWGIEEFKAFSFDTLLVGSLLDENRSNSLNTHAKVCTPMGGYDDSFNGTHDKSRMDLALAKDPEGFKVYAGGDTDACLRTANAFRPQLLADKRLANFYVNLLHPAAQAFRKVEQRGMCVNVGAYHELETDVAKEITGFEKQINKLIDPRILTKWNNKNPLVPNMIKDYLFSHPRGLRLKPLMFTAKAEKKDIYSRNVAFASTSSEHLQELGMKNETARRFAELMELREQAKKTLSTYIRGFMVHVRSDGRFHPTYMLHKGEFKGDDSGTVTGRSSAKDPAYQTIPKHTKYAKALRRVYVPPPGHVILNVDFSQGELRIAACIANEQAMIDTYRQGIDLHLKTGASVFGMELEEALAMKAAKDPKIKEIRQGGKAGNFGLLYGMAAVPGFQNYARRQYFVHLSAEQSYAFHENFFDTYTNLHPWHDSSKEFAHAHEYIRSPLGRIRHLPLINSFNRSVVAKQERQGINAQVQSTLSDMCLLAAGILERKYPDLWCFGFTHDALSFYIPEDEVDVWVPRIVEVMAHLPLKEMFHWEHQLDFPVEVELAGPSEPMSDMEEVPLSTWGIAA